MQFSTVSMNKPISKIVFESFYTCVRILTPDGSFDAQPEASKEKKKNDTQNIYCSVHCTMLITQRESAQTDTYPNTDCSNNTDTAMAINNAQWDNESCFGIHQ